MNTHTDTNTVSDGTDSNHTTRAGHKTRAGSRNRKWFAAIALGAAAFALAACTPVQALPGGDAGGPVVTPVLPVAPGDPPVFHLPGRGITCEEQAAIWDAEIGADADKFASAREEWLDMCRSNGGTVFVPDVAPEFPEVPDALSDPMWQSIEVDECRSISAELAQQLWPDRFPTVEDVTKVGDLLNELCGSGTITNADQLLNTEQGSVPR